MSEHTPGPWHWTNEHATQDGRETWSVVAECGYGVLSCDGTHNSPQCCNSADARLISAAPDLLAACKTLVAVDSFAKHDGENCFACDNAVCLAACPVRMARAAIAKAEGGAA